MFLRPESSVSIAFNEWDEEVFAGDAPGPVIHRTPEELGIPRVVPDVPVRVMKNVRPDFEERSPSGSFRGPLRLAQRKRDAPKRSGQCLVVSGQKKQPQILRVAQDDKRLGEGEMPERTADDVRQRVIAAASENSVNAIAGMFKLTWGTVNGILKEAGVTAKRGRTGRTAERAAKPKAKLITRGPSLQRTIDVDPQRLGTAAALIGALAKRDAATSPAVRIELSQAEVAALIAKLSDEQRGAMLAAGLKAAIRG